MIFAAFLFFQGPSPYLHWPLVVGIGESQRGHDNFDVTFKSKSFCNLADNIYCCPNTILKFQHFLPLWCQMFLTLDVTIYSVCCFIWICREAIGGKTGKTLVLPWLCKIEHGSGGSIPWYGGLSLLWWRTALWWCHTGTPAAKFSLYLLPQSAVFFFHIHLF